MSKFLALLVAAAVFSNGSPLHAQTPPEATPTEAAPSPAADVKVYGEYPMGYKAIISRWLETKLADPTSAVIDWGEAPKAGEYVTQKQEHFVGYVVDFKVNARNQFGAPTGKQKYRVVIRNGEVVWGGRPRY